MSDLSKSLSVIAGHGYISVMSLLLDSGADIHYDNDAALQISVIKNHIHTVKLLLEYGAQC